MLLLTLRKIKKGFLSEKCSDLSKYKIDKTQSVIETDCIVCFDSDLEYLNPIVYCSRCNASFHKHCFGIQKIPEGDFYCDVCEEQMRLKKNSLFLIRIDCLCTL